MSISRPSNVTALLKQWQEGHVLAMERLLPMVHDELWGGGRARLRGERHWHTLQATALVHEAYLRLVGPGRPAPKTRVPLRGGEVLQLHRPHQTQDSGD